ncbi:hypothetical protein RLO149_c022670 [Roseobacter litoralis Och 149]|uniref:Uncharacterized protein n=1 Tax=Roseobacter litoralis (strain ATCC 49566 / DSM 6996 / JCM 21268 / NBRC 15278 / OCh 149) TaxID=391595 RepID=F7ZAP5_ROSLO|nr:hypothetical protein RLO149_c022670 [Roseobacter litoralis Och 149]
MSGSCDGARFDLTARGYRVQYKKSGRGLGSGQGSIDAATFLLADAQDHQTASETQCHLRAVMRRTNGQ